MSVEGQFNRSVWTKEQDKAFEECLATYAGEPNDRWKIIAAALTGKTREEIEHHYELLVEDVNAIESGNVPLPIYADLAEDSKNEDDSAVSGTGKARSKSSRAGKALRVEVERRKGLAWTPDEHRKFLKGLERYGKGDWRSISRHCVRSRTPTQVASHAQKYFNRLNSGTKQRKRNSIHDVTCEDEGQTSAPQGPVEITGASASGSSAITEKSTPPVPPPLHVNVGETSDPFESIMGDMDEVSAAELFTAAGMPSPSLGCPFMGPPSQLVLPSQTQTVFGFDAPPLTECSIFDISDVPFY